jgi:hypothetical protein
MAAAISDTLVDAERELQETQNKHQTLLVMYANATEYGQKHTRTQKARVLQSLIHTTKQSLVQQKKTYDMKNRSSAFMQYARNAKDNHTVLKQCLREVDHLKVAKPKSSRKLCKNLAKKKVMLERSSDDTHYISEVLAELPLDDYDIDEEDEVLVNDLDALYREVMDNLPSAPLSGVESEPSVHTDVLKNYADDNHCK